MTVSAWRPRARAHSLPEAGTFASDPGLAEAWWWLGIPFAIAVFLIAAYALAPDWYMAYVLPEGYGLLEVSHFFIPLAASLLAAGLLMRPFVRRQPLLVAYLAAAALGCFYIAGEEMSWGQHWFNWSTPDDWAAINRQQETNLHNINEWLNEKPRALIQAGIFLGGLVLPLLALFWPRVRRNRFALFLPADAMVPTAIGFVFFRSVGSLEKHLGIPALVYRPSETTETYIYLFLLYYLIVFARRLTEIEGRSSAPAARH